jgi:IS605 OrfB family transposase
MGKRHGHQVGIEAKVDYQSAFDTLGVAYESWRRTALNWMQDGASEDDVEKRLQKEFGIQWAWADSIATEAAQCFSQLSTAKVNQIAQLKDRIKAKSKAANIKIKDLSKQVKKKFTGFGLTKFKLDLMGLKSKVAKVESLKKDLERLESTKRLHICFGSRKLFNAQYHLEENGYQSKAEWLADWRKKRSGRFLCVGKSQHGGGTMIKVFATDDDGSFRMEITVPRPLQDECGKVLVVPFTVADRKSRTRLADLNYALENQKPITAQIFRREHKGDQWYVHLATYVQNISWVHTRANGCIGLDFNADHISAAYIKPDGNIGYCTEFPFKWKGKTTGQRQAMMRDVVACIVKMAEFFQCAIAIESLDFSKKKAKMTEESKAYNEMLSNLSTALFRTTLESRCKRYGVQLIKVNPAFTSVIGMIKFMSQYGLNSGTAAGMTIARRAMHLSERLPKCLARPEDQVKHNWSSWNRVARFFKTHSTPRWRLFQWTKTLGAILSCDPSQKQKCNGNADSEHSPSLPVAIEIGDSKTQSIHRGIGVQLCLGF